MSNRKPSVFLILLSYIYAVGVRLRLAMYRLNIFHSEKVEGVKVISIGNLTVGGTGKTPVTIMTARLMNDKTAVVSRGYKRTSQDPVQVVSDGQQALASYPDAADEALLCAAELEGIAVICSPRRVDGVRAAAEKFQCKTVILDDGYSHLAIARDKNILLIDALDPFGGGLPLPAGRLREPLASLDRADAIIITRTNLVPPAELIDVNLEIRKHAKTNFQIFRCSIAPDKVVTGDGTRHSPNEFLRGKAIRLLSGIAKPEQLEKMVSEAGATIEKHYAFRDHHNFTAQELETILSERQEKDILVTTAKDAVRLPASMQKEVAVLTIKAEMTSEDQNKFVAWLFS